MNLKLNNSQIEKFSRQIILKNVGTEGQKKIIRSKVLIIGMGGLGCSVAEFLTRAGVGSLGMVDSDKVDLSNLLIAPVTRNFFDTLQKSFIKNLVLKLSDPSITKSYFFKIFLKFLLSNLIL